MQKITASLCPECKKIIPAMITIDEQVTMHKECSKHGIFDALVEPDPDFYLSLQSNEPVGIYDGYFLKVTDVCNLNCKYCYNANGTTHRDIDEIVAEALKYKHLGSMLLTGGEPTTHPNLIQILDILCNVHGIPVEILTNAVELDYEAVTVVSPLVNVSLSLHKESNGADITLLETGKKITTVLAVIDELSQIDDLVKIYEKYPHIPSMRIKAASNIGAEKGVVNKIFTSDMLGYFVEKRDTEVIDSVNNKVSFLNILHKGMHFMLVCWYDKYNIDVVDVDCGPFHPTATIPQNLATAVIMNEN